MTMTRQENRRVAARLPLHCHLILNARSTVLCNCPLIDYILGHRGCSIYIRANMARGVEGNEVSTPKPPHKSSKPSSSQSNGKGNQKSLLGFFQKAGQAPQNSPAALPSKPSSSTGTKPSVELTPAPSSDPPEMSSPTLPSRNKTNGASKSKKDNAHGPQLPISPASSAIATDAPAVTNSPSRKVHRHMPTVTINQLT